MKIGLPSENQLGQKQQSGFWYAFNKLTSKANSVKVGPCVKLYLY